MLSSASRTLTVQFPVVVDVDEYRHDFNENLNNNYVDVLDGSHVLHTRLGVNTHALRPKSDHPFEHD